MTTLTESNDNDRPRVLEIFNSVGRTVTVEEKLFDVCTALAGSGPAFVFAILDAFSLGAVSMGLPRSTALLLAAQSMSFMLWRTKVVHDLVIVLLQRSRAPLAWYWNLRSILRLSGMKLRVRLCL